MKLTYKDMGMDKSVEVTTVRAGATFAVGLEKKHGFEGFRMFDDQGNPVDHLEWMQALESARRLYR
ncbi:MAG: hypothetical protein JSS66_00205 [Armatimonadetes bacterium]|nr:hypothetical protein [Armatimonadota bacterium]